MKTIHIDNGEIRNGYTFDDLDEEGQYKVLVDHIKFLIETMDEDSIYFDAVKEMERYRTPWFLAETLFHDYKKQIIEDIKMNGYLFDEDGKILPIMYHTNGNKIVKTTFNNHKCTIK